ncbi:methylenetetrahydrofolate reductase [Cellulomonas sp. KRMCY2]|uniref:methylenetetrahydrofolate reductase n=1 Tax=Cellulomonas sp. KRMCY2 TaxID=1304865 RepID=UPI00045E78BD|nr:methylenetetrahydrofolate reductase [Cellulomonas sp. KRMCY2]
MNDVPAPARRPSGVAARLQDAVALGPTVSFELYPPRTPAANETLWSTIARLAEATPDFFSVTYGASGSSRETSRAVVQWILAHTSAPAVAHLTCIGAPRPEVQGIAAGLLADGVRDFLALRGDPPAGATDWQPHPDGLERASELVSLLREIEPASEGAALSIGVAATPAAVPPGTLPGDELCGDLQALLAKQAGGADYAITQVFFDPEDYTRYTGVARAAGVTIPLLPGIVPLNDPARLRRLQEISGVPVPASILARLDAETDELRRRAAGTAMGVELAEAVLQAGAPGLHVYTFNQHRAALELLAGAHLDARSRAPRTDADLAGSSVSAALT